MSTQQRRVAESSALHDCPFDDRHDLDATADEPAITETAGTSTPWGQIDPDRWPDVASVPHSPVRAAVAHRLFRHAAGRLPIRVFEAGRSAPYGGGGPDAPAMSGSDSIRLNGTGRSS